MRLAFGVLLLCVVASGGPVEEAAETVLAAFRAKQDLSALAVKEVPSPWQVADALCARGEFDAAAAFAGAASRPGVKKLADYVERERRSPTDAALRRSLEQALAAFRRGDLAAVLRATGSASEGPTNVTRVLMLHARGTAFARTGKIREAVETLFRGGDRLRDLGWLHAAGQYYQYAIRVGAQDPRTMFEGAKRRLAIDILLNDKLGAAKSRYLMGASLRRMGKLKSAVELLEEALPVVRDVPAASPVYLRVLGHLGDAYRDLSRFDDSVRVLQTALRVARATNNRSREAVSLAQLATVWEHGGKYKKALEVVPQALAIFQKLGRERDVAGTLQAWGILLDRVARYDEALVKLQEALRMFRRLRDGRGIAGTLNAIASGYQARGEVARAAALYRQVIQIQARLGMPSPEPLANLGSVLTEQGAYSEAQARMKQALALHTRRGDLAGQARVRGNLAILFERLGDRPREVENLREGLRLAKAVGARAQVARLTGNLGQSYMRLGRYAAATATCRDSIRLCEDLGDRHLLAGLWIGLGNVHRVVARFSEALDCFRKAREVAESIGARGKLVSALRAQGGVHLDLGDTERALEYYRRAIAESRKLGTKLQVLESLHGLAGASEPAAAKRLLEEAVSLAQGLGDAGWEALMKLELARLAMGEGTDPRRVVEVIQRAQEVLRESQATQRSIQMKLLLAQCYGSLNENKRALALCREVEAEAEKLGLSGHQVRALAGIAIAHYNLQAPEKAIRATRELIELLPVLLGHLGPREGSAARAQVADCFDVGVLAAGRLKRAREALFFLESGRAGALLEALQGRERLLRVTLPRELLDREDRARADEQVAQTLYLAARSRDDKAQTERRRGERDKARAELAETIASLQRTAKREARLLYPRPVELQRLRAALKEGEAMVLYALSRETVMAFVVTKDGLRARVLEAKPEIVASFEAQVGGALARPRGMREAVRNPVSIAGSIDRIRKAIVEPLELGPGIRRVLVSPDGALHGVPMSLLFPDREVVHIPSGTAYEFLLTKARKRGTGVLAVGNPDGSLPAAEAEAKTIGDDVLVGARATETAFRRLVLERKRWRAVHVACHGVIDSARPMFSSLALRADDKNDGSLTALDVIRMSVPTDLVVLSACETAKGKVFRAEGVLGFTHAFLYAGAQRVLVSLWKVDDQATRALMEKFYALWKDSKLPAATALRKAQEHVASQPKWKHPYFWAAWQLWGLGE